MFLDVIQSICFCGGLTGPYMFKKPLLKPSDINNILDEL